MSVTYLDTIDPRVETLILLEHAFTDGDAPKTALEEMTRICDSYHIPVSDLRTAVAPVAALEEYVRSRLNEPKEIMQFLFSPCNGNACLAWSLLIETLMDADGMSREPRTKGEILRLTARFAAEKAELTLPETQKLETLEDLARYLDSIETPDRDKWKYMRLSMHYSEYEALALEIVTEAAAHFEERFPAELREYYAAVTRENREKFETMFSKLLAGSEQEFRVYPCAMAYYAVRFVGVKTGMLVFAGVHYWTIAALVEKYAGGGDWLLERLKAISDQSRMEILQILKKESCQGQEIAERLSLTPGTVSHHLNLLTRNGLIQVLKKDGRIRWELDTAAIEELLRALCERLLP